MQDTFEVRPPFVCRLLCVPFVTRCRCRDGWLLLKTREGDRAIRLEAVLRVRWTERWFLGSLLLVMAGDTQVQLDWIWQEDATRIIQAHKKAHQQAQFNRLQKRVHAFLESRWRHYRKSIASWKAILRRGLPVEDVGIHAWLQAGEVLPLPGNADEVVMRKQPANPRPGTEVVPNDPQSWPVRVDAWDASVAQWQREVTRSFARAIEEHPLYEATEGAVVAEYAEVRQLREQVEFFLRSSLPRYEQAMVAWKALFHRKLYIAASDVRRWLKAHEGLSSPDNVCPVITHILPQSYREVLDALCSALRDIRSRVDDWNNTFVRGALQDLKDFFDTAEKYPLTTQQRQAILRDEDNNLVVAGAGTGKTSTIAGKVGYLFRRELAHPSEILLLAFTRKAAGELQERIERLFKEPVKVRTFHSLGLEIIGEATGRKPSLWEGADDDNTKKKVLKEICEEILRKDASFRHDFVRFQAFFRTPYRSAWEFKRVADYYAYLKSADLLTFQGKLVRSMEELEIANFLTLNSIQYEYEAPYPINTATKSRRQYKPDFFLPDFGIYIEHFGVDRSGNPPPFFSEKDRCRYIEDMDWKRKLHQRHGTNLIETYSWQKREGTLLEQLRSQLEGNRVRFTPAGQTDLLNELNEQGKIDPTYQLIGTFLSIFKSGDYTVSELRLRIDQASDSDRLKLFLRIFSTIFTRYSEMLASNGEIDFDDMIAQATEYVREGRYRSEFRYIIVDEFQDIAKGRANLIRTLRDQVEGCKVFCVGDDWQSIYRFTGSDLSLMTNFAGHFGDAKLTALEKTFRFPDKLNRFSSSFITKNPVQIRKTLTTHRQDAKAPVQIYLTKGEEDLLPEVLRAIAEEVGERKSTVFVLNRYRFQAKGEDYKAHLMRAYAWLDVHFLTVHSSKGLEADYIIVDNLRSGHYGFPTEIVDDPIISLVLAQPDAYEYGEERRLFYVAITRSRNRVFLIADAERQSSFIREILSDAVYEKCIASKSARIPDPCPSCEGGWMVQRDSEFGIFFSCSNYPWCSYKEDACSECRKGRARRGDNLATHCEVCGYKGRVCPACRKGLFVRRNSP